MSDDDESGVTIDARRFAGVWVNAVEVEAWPDEVTMDFIRFDPVESPGRRPGNTVLFGQAKLRKEGGSG